MELTLKAETGRPTGTRPARRMRDEGKVPGTVYGLSQDPISVAVDWIELRKVLTTDAGLNALIQLDIDGQTDLTIVKDLQRHPIRRNVLHVDFLRIDADVDVEVEVPIVLTGHSEAVERRGGMVEQYLHTLTIKAKPGSIPTQLEVEISHVDVGTVVTVAEIALPDGVTTSVEGDDPIAAGTATRATLEAERTDEEGEGAEGEEGDGADSGDD